VCSVEDVVSVAGSQSLSIFCNSGGTTHSGSIDHTVPFPKFRFAAREAATSGSFEFSLAELCNFIMLVMLARMRKGTSNKGRNR
jgi:hypothetical protein